MITKAKADKRFLEIVRKQEKQGSKVPVAMVLEMKLREAYGGLALRF
jgi:hypothetical protein